MALSSRIAAKRRGAVSIPTTYPKEDEHRKITAQATMQTDSRHKVANVQEYGAVPDGSTDSSSAFQAAVDASKYVFIPVGSYVCTSAVTLSAGAHVSGAGYLNSIVTFTAATKGFVWEPSVLTEGDIYLSDFAIKGTASALDLVSFKLVTVGRIERMSVRNTSKNCIKLDDSSINWAIRDCKIEDFTENGIYLKNAANVIEIANIDFTQNSIFGDNAVLIEDSGIVEINGANVNGNSQAIQLLGLAGDTAGSIALRGCYIEGTTASAVYAYADGNTLPDGTTQSGNVALNDIIIENCALHTSNSIAVDLNNGDAHRGIRIHNISSDTIPNGGFMFDPGTTVDWDYTGGDDLSGVPADNIVGSSFNDLREARWTIHKTYTPTLTNITNVDANTAYECQYSYVQGSVVVSGRVDIDPTAAAATQIDISLPLASGFTTAQQLSGTAVCRDAFQAGVVFANATNDRARLEFIASDTSNREWRFIFQYQII